MIEADETTKLNSVPKKHRGLVILAILILIFALSWLWSWMPVVEHMEIDVPDADGYVATIVLLTDLHSCYYGPGQKWLLDAIDKEEPDIILLGGDFFDDVLDDDNAKTTAEYLAKNYNCYYVTGNHEFWSGRAGQMKQYMSDIDINVLEGDCISTTLKETWFDICGIDDPEVGEAEWKQQLERAYSQTQEGHIRLLLTHRPERVSDYQKYDFDLILAGHAHAGQILIPFINKGVFAPDQGFMAEYVNGAYMLPNGSIMEVSRGLGRESTFAPRFFNHPEIVVIDIH